MIRFEMARLLFYKDLERCPYAMFTSEAAAWHRKKDHEDLLTALERYLFIFDYLQKTNQHVREK